MSTGEEESKDLLFLSGEIKSPPFSDEARQEAGQLPRDLQDGESIGMPKSRPMPSIGPGCHELRIRDESHNWRIFYRIEPTLILVLDIVEKKTPKMPKRTIDLCKRRLRDHDARRGEGESDD